MMDLFYVTIPTSQVSIFMHQISEVGEGEIVMASGTHIMMPDMSRKDILEFMATKRHLLQAKTDPV